MKTIRLIELFAGIGSQASALERLGIDFEHYRVVEFDKYAIKSYNAIHGTDFKPMDITKIKGIDLGISKTYAFTYLLTYSFPCQDLSVAGKQRGMSKGTGTRSGLLWEVERLLNECEELPQVLLMENVPQVHGKKNINDFNNWIKFLESKGYKNFWKDLNAKDYGVAQNRNRCFMVSLLGNYNYHFPNPIPLTKKMKDYLEDEVDEKYYINNEKAQKLILKLINNEVLSSREACDLSINKPKTKEIANCIMARYDSGISNYKADGTGVIECKVKQIGNVFPTDKRNNPNQGRVYDSDRLSPCINTMQGGNLQPCIVEEPKVIGGLGIKKSNNGTQYYQQDRVYTSEGVAMCHPANIPGGSYKYLISAMRGRGEGQQLENPKDISNSLTTVQKDNLVIYKECISTKGNKRDIASTVLSGYERTNMTGFNADNGVIEKIKIKQATKKGYIECDINGVADMSYPDSTTRRGRVQKQGQVSPTLTRAGSENICKIESEYRIRKLTPKECWRLMGFTDEEFTKAAAVNSNTQLYKQAGNSIVVDVLVAIFSNLIDTLEDKEPKYADMEQISLFDYDL